VIIAKEHFDIPLADGRKVDVIEYRQERLAFKASFER
jgi:hypothetical protein